MKADLSLHLVTDDRLPLARLLEVAEQAVAGGVTVVQLRAKSASARDQVAALVSLSALLRGSAALIVNDRVDVALAARDAGAQIDGVHLGQQDVSPVTARRLLGSGALVGWSASRTSELTALPAGTVDYLGVGAVHPTSTKPDHPPALGVNGFGAFASAASPVPCVAIGGIGTADVGPLRAAGAAGVAVVSAICSADDPRAAATALRSRWDAAALASAR
ncbi:thiamine-phosphate pyrophosphorylase/hydroxymethylpyrimidine kinase/phosphomethylpyrimidine kinase/thiamine-phosphate diphosphorylase [Branchiibius hedensis]|uniref:Thiamine-phosphate synthase n=1 Tax=Branchiibius hedensis TaxID=672460 RepID=A0A2Y9C211_9MICO|nr:thiamine phosphate synthase [Branchiibius hedensis]PWJ26451.1 thiamine-phosphate pyrophosphorylase/hydroxymethylpyrimidine kinase/phosphomethylpyrimidine kinase/thiamine-phosphate diphosphorylase [Branchiibius hedensis]SSA35263.1 thiamine-phosphate pyrophosphorylase [Branchiibius hedensis]